MATREENLKKINDELEKLDDEQLEQIAGGWRMRPYTNGLADATKAEILEDKPDLTIHATPRF